MHLMFLVPHASKHSSADFYVYGYALGKDVVNGLPSLKLY
jgi:hypothetical protein